MNSGHKTLLPDDFKKNSEQAADLRESQQQNTLMKDEKTIDGTQKLKDGQIETGIIKIQETNEFGRFSYKELANDQKILQFFESLKNVEFHERSAKILELIRQKEHESFSLTELNRDQAFYDDLIKEGSSKFNQKFCEQYKILFDDLQEKIQIEDIKKIITGCIIYLNIKSRITEGEHQSVVGPKILEETFFKSLNREVANNILIDNLFESLPKEENNSYNQVFEEEKQSADFQIRQETPEPSRFGQNIEMFQSSNFQHQNLVGHTQSSKEQATPQQNGIEEQISQEDLFDQNPKKYLEMLAKNKNWEAPDDLEKKIQSMFSKTIDKACQRKVKDFFRDIQDFLDEEDKDEESLIYTQKKVQECLDALHNSQNCEKLYGVLYQYSVYKIPEISLVLNISKEEIMKKEFQEISQILPLINEQYMIGNFMKIFETGQFEKNFKDIKIEFEKEGKINGKKLILLLFDCIKRKINFNLVIQLFTQIKSDFKITSQILFTYLYLHSDAKLRIFIIISCSQYMALPVSLLNPWSLDKQNQMPQRIYFDELFYVFEKYNSVFQFKFLANENEQGVQGCTKIINQMLGRSFQVHQSSIANEGLIEIQFDYNCSEVQYLTVADAHGQLEPEIIEHFSKLFEILIIHTDKAYKENTKLQDLVQKLNQNKKQDQQKHIIIMVHSNNVAKDEQPIEINANTIQLKTLLINKLLENNFNNLIDNCLRLLQKGLKNILNSYLNDPIKRLDKKQEYLNFLESRTQNQNIQKHYNCQQILKQLIGIIIQQEDFTSLDFLPMVQFSQQRSSYENQIQNEALKMTEQELREQEGKLKDLEQKMKNQNFTQLSQAFYQIIDLDLQIEILPILSLYIKGYLQSIKIPLEKQIAKLKEEISQSNSQQEEILSQKIKDLQQKINQKIFSQEYIIREIYELSIYSSMKNSFYEKQISLTTQLYRDCQPLELINGDTNKFVTKIYENVFKSEKKQEVMVISVVGQQSAGKSLLLNFLFGTQFHSSAARCTKGVYASVISFETSNGKQKKILLLDTEGIQSQEKNDSQFDRKIIYFILSVSHVILLCNKQEMNKDMGEILKLVADQLVNAKQRNVHSPKVYMILNMLNQTNNEIRIECVKQLQNDLAIIDKDKDIESLNKTLHISEDNVFTFQFAFKKEDYKIYMQDGQTQSNQVNIPLIKFQDEILVLRQAILQNFQLESQLSLNEWLEFAQENWKYTNTLRSLEIYINIQQKKEDKIIKDIKDQLIEKHYNQRWSLETKSKIDKLIKETEEKFSGGSSISLSIVRKENEDKLNEIFDQIEKEFINDFNNGCIQQKISKEMIEKSLTVFKREKQYKYSAWAYLIKKSQQFITKKFQNVGDSTLQEILKQFLKKDDYYTPEQAEKIFEEEAWPYVIQIGTNVLESEEDTKQRNINFIGNQFSQVIKNGTQEIQSCCIQQSEKSNDSQKLLTLLQEKFFEKQNVLMYIGDKKFSNIQKILQFLDKEQKQYLTELPKNIYIQTAVYKYYFWSLFLENCVDKDILQQDIYQCLKNEGGFLWEWKSKEQISEKIELIISNLQNQLRIFGIEYIGGHERFIPSERNNNQIDQKKNLQEIIKKNIEMIFSQQPNFKIIQSPPISYFDKYNELRYLILIKEVDNEINTYHQQNYVKKFSIKQDQQNNEDHNKMWLLDEQDEQNDIIFQENIQIHSQMQINADLSYYFTYLADSKSTFLSPSEIKSAIGYFFDQLNWKLILEQIDECILRILLKPQKQNVKNMLFEQIIEIIQKKDKQSFDLKQKFNELDLNLIKKIIQEVRQIIYFINQELDNFCLTVSDVGENLIYYIAQTRTFSLIYNLDLIKQIQPLRMIEQNKQREKSMFIAKLTNDDNGVDKNLAEKLANEFSKKCFINCKDLIVNQFNIQINEIKEQFQKIQLVNELEQQCLEIHKKKSVNKDYQLSDIEQQQLNKMIELKINPRQLLLSEFEQKFNLQVKDLIQEYYKNFNERFQNQHQILQNYLQDFLAQMKNKQIDKAPANMLFLLHKDSPTKLNYEKDQKFIIEYQKQALMRYFQSIMMQEQQFYNYKFENDKIWFKISDDYLVPVFRDIKDYEKFDDYYQKIFNDILLDNDYITNLGSFVQSIITNLEILKTQFINQDQIQPQDDNIQHFVLKEEDLFDISKNQLMKNYLGCIEHCPLCRKQCDVDHKDNENLNDEKHGCQTGHQFQAFGGSKISVDNKAILLSCDELKDNKKIMHNDQQFIWKQFKEQYPQWIFDSQSQQTVRDNIEKNIIIWNLIGQEICNKFEQKGKNIVYNEAPSILQYQYDKTHYIFMLDSSSSMRYNDIKSFFGYYTVGFFSDKYNKLPWNSLIENFKFFLQRMTYNADCLQNSKISVITYNSKSTILFTEETPDMKLLSKINHTGGFTNFDNPLIDAYKICQSNKEHYKNIVLYFLTDGEGAFNQSNILKFVQDQSISEKIKFYAVGLGKNANSNFLKQMIRAFPGAGYYLQALNHDELRESFEKIIAEIYDY